MLNLGGAPREVLLHDRLQIVDVVEEHLLEIADRLRTAVVPFGLGSGVCGGVEPGADAVVVDLSRMAALVRVDRPSLVATAQAGLRGSECERLLGEQGLTLGHFPQSFEFASVGGFAATRSSGQDSAGYGRFDAMVLGLRVVTDGVAIGPILMGISRPVHILTTSATPRRVINMTAIAAVDAQIRQQREAERSGPG